MMEFRLLSCPHILHKVLNSSDRMYSVSFLCVTVEHLWRQERRYLLKEFPELASCEDNSKVLEVGCGNGSTALPLLWYFLEEPIVLLLVFSFPCSFF